MKYEERECNLFDLEKKGYLFAHCISLDLALGAGIAKSFRDRYNMKQLLFDFKKEHPEYFETFNYGFCVIINNTANLITKDKYFNKPTMQTLKESLMSLKKYIVKNNITKLAMPKIGCGLDRLEWSEVSFLIKEIFKDLELDIIVCYI